MPKENNRVVALSEGVKSWSEGRDPDKMIEKIESKMLLNLYPGQLDNNKMSKPKSVYRPFKRKLRK